MCDSGLHNAIVAVNVLETRFFISSVARFVVYLLLFLNSIESQSAKYNAISSLYTHYKKKIKLNIDKWMFYYKIQD